MTDENTEDTALLGSEKKGRDTKSLVLSIANTLVSSGSFAMFVAKDFVDDPVIKNSLHIASLVTGIVTVMGEGIYLFGKKNPSGAQIVLGCAAGSASILYTIFNGTGFEEKIANMRFAPVLQIMTDALGGLGTLSNVLVSASEIFSPRP